jgi:hypothetical protein
MWQNFLILLTALMLVGCTDSPYANMSNNEIHARARVMPLAQRYAFYREVLDSRIPANAAVADDLAALGKPARTYTIAQALGGKRQDLMDALTVLSAFDGRCSAAEWSALNNKAAGVAYNAEDRRLLEMHVSVACEVAAPPGYRNPWPRSTSED